MESRLIKLAVLGSTGSIGRQSLDIARKFSSEFKVTGLACGNNVKAFEAQLREFKPRLACSDGKISLPAGTRRASMEEIASHPDVDTVVISTTGKAGLAPALAALKAGKTLAIANKEILVMAGELITQMAARHGATIVPIDSEHSAIWQCLQGETGLHRLILTASGGPFYKKPRSYLKGVTVEQALKHPTWHMGKKVTIDSATLFNKGLEAIEAHWLFDIPYEKIEIIIHRQSIVHSMVEFVDGSIKAQLSTPDMHLPIQYALLYPRRLPNENIARLHFPDIKKLTFEAVKYSDFPCLKLALEAASDGGTCPAVLCAADEIAIEQFLKKAITFLDISKIIDKTLSKHKRLSKPSLDDILQADKWARDAALKVAKDNY